MDELKNGTVLDNLKETYEELSTTEKKIADFILHSPEETINYNVSELANASGTSDATIIRFCKHIGYSGYYQLRIMLSREVGRIEHVQETKTDGISDLFREYASNIMSIGRNIKEERFKECANLLMNCHCVHIVAAGNTTPLGQYLGFRLGRLGIRASYHVLPEYYLNDIVLAQKEDIVFAISQSGASKQVVQAVQLAMERGIRTIAVVGYEYSPVSRLADYLLPAIVPAQAFDYRKNYAHLYEMAVIDALLEYVENRNEKQAQADIQEMLMSDMKL